jgi:pimeloyl-ACP methyl ester carboxylesterase
MLQFYQRNPGRTIMMGLLFAWALSGAVSPHLQLYQENREVIWTILDWIFAAAIIYSALVALLYLRQRSLQYFPEPVRTTPLAAGLPKAEEVMLDTADGEHVIVWHTPPRDGYPVFLYFHGHAGSLRTRAERFRELTADGSGLVALSYRGFGGSSGQPTEAGLIEDAATAYTFAAARYGTERIVLWGESLGTAVAIATAAEKRVGHVVLEAPLTSAADVGALQYWFVPVRILMKDQFRADLRVGKIAAPTLAVHGENDAIIPIALGERIYDLIRAPKRFVRVAGAGHTDLGARAVSAAKQFIAEEHQRIQRDGVHF